MADPREYGPIDYAYNGDDNGYNDPGSIEPVTNGEPANENTFQRPSENIRDRTEILRMTVEQLEAVVSSDRGLVIASDPSTTVTWNGHVSGGGGGDGKFTTTGDITFVPLTNPSATNANNNIYNRLSYDDGTNDFFSIRSRLRVGDEGGNNLKFEIFKIAAQNPATPTLTVEGSTNDAGDFDPRFGPLLVRCQIADNDSHDWSDVVSEIDTPTTTAEPVETWFDASVEGGIASNAAKVIAEQFLWESPGGSISSVCGVDAQTYRITAATFASFFTTKVLAENDVLVINFGSREARLARAGHTTIQAAELEIISQNENNPPTAADEFSEGGNANFMNVIPICKVLNNDLFFLNGAVFTKALAGTIMQDTTLRSALADDDTTVGTCGAELVGSDLISGTPQSLPDASTVFAQLTSMLQIYNDHANGNADLHKWEKILGKPFFTVGTNGEYADLTAAFSALSATGGTLVIISNQTGPFTVNVTENFHIFSLPGKYILNTTASASVINFTGLPTTTKGKFIFEDCTFIQSGAGAPVIDATADNQTAWMTFRNCVFQKNLTNTDSFVENDSQARFLGCSFWETSSGNQDSAFELSNTSATKQPHTHVENCHFYNIESIAKGAGAVDPLGSIVFKNNHFKECCYAFSDSDIRILFDFNPSTYSFEDIQISGNLWDGTTTANVQGRFCRIKGNGVIADNVIECDVDDVDPDAIYALEVEGLSHSQRIVVENNQIRLGQLAGITATYALLRGNRIEDLGTAASVSNHRGVYCNDYVDVVDCHITITGGPSGLAQLVAVESDGDYCTIRGCSFTGAADSNYYINILTANANIVVDNTLFTGDTDSTRGIALSSTGSDHVVKGNLISGLGTAVYDEADNVVLSGNTIIGGGSSDDAIALLAAAITVSNNSIRNARYAIYLGSAAERVAISGNVISDCVQGVSSDSNVSDAGIAIVSNSITACTDHGIYITNNVPHCVAGNMLDNNTNEDMSVPATSTNIGIGIPGACVQTHNWYNDIGTP